MTTPFAHPLVVDVRSPGEFAAGHMAGSINLPLNMLQDAACDILPGRDAPIVLCCVSGARSEMAAQWLRAQGYTQVTNGGSVGAVALRLGNAMEKENA
ncbi:rhodanese-like domain-containing protein [Alicycliphilus sp. T452]|jgi:phage shock protein E